MKSTRLALLNLALATFVAIACGSLPAQAGGRCPAITLSCENGHHYALCPTSISDKGDIVTANLTLSPRHGTPVRLVPMGVGYRYISAGGIWLDGVKNEAVLNLGKHRSVYCTVANN